MVGHDDVLAGLVQPGLTTVDGRAARVGQLAVDRLLAEADPGAPPDTEHVGVATQVVWRSSIGAPIRALNKS